jgi:siderophore synthetase component
MTIKHFSATNELGVLSVRPFNTIQDIEIIFNWTSQPYAKFWGYVDSTLEELTQEYNNLCDSDDTQVYLGSLDNVPMFLLELYNPEKQRVGEYYQYRPGDIGMHILIAPSNVNIHNFTYKIFNFVMDFIFKNTSVTRVVVEPDINNFKIHNLNKRIGFQHIKKIDLGHKYAYLAFCDRECFQRALLLNEKYGETNFRHQFIHDNPEEAITPITMENWQLVNNQLVQKIIRETAHERIILPKLIAGNNSYKITSDDGSIHYDFYAQVMRLNHWSIDVGSIFKYENGNNKPLDAVEFILEFSDSLAIPQAKLATYLEEVTSTLSSAAFKLASKSLTSFELCDADFQKVETGMTEGHPSFIANNGRIGFDAGDFHSYAPEVENKIQILWLATHKNYTHFSCSETYSYDQLLEDEFDLTTRNHFNNIFLGKGLVAEEYYLIPVHPWQWFNKLINVYASDIAKKNIVCLGYGDDHYLAQQSIRTFFNVSFPSKHYVKTALSILNMGFMRGLSAYYMRSTPAINDWLYNMVKSDDVLINFNFNVLREIAAVGYSNSYYEDDRLKESSYNKMLAGLWRESPVNKISDNQNLMTMASLLHVDKNRKGVLPALISKSMLNESDWLDQYFQAYLSPLLHCYFKYSLVFMPHGENLIMIMENYVPVGMFMKDIGEEICILNSEQTLPPGVERISIKMPSEMEELSVFTDIFDGFFRYMNEILVSQLNIDEQIFWQRVARCIQVYQFKHPEFEDKFIKHDLFADEFPHSCLNRLQLNNNHKMVDLSDPGGSLKFSGTLSNPIAQYKVDKIKTLELVQEMV